MRVLMVGAGAVGGYFGGRLVEKGEDVTFLVRKKRQEQLEQNGLVIKSVNGNAELKVKTLTAGQPAPAFDLIILSVKAYHLTKTLNDLKPYVGENTTILPLLNGIIHIQQLQNEFGAEKILGGLCFIESTLNDKGEIEQYSPQHEIVYGELNGDVTKRILDIQALFDGAGFDARYSQKIRIEMWQKYIFISAMSGMTCLMNSSIGPILSAPYGKEMYQQLLEEIVSVAHHQEPEIPTTLAGKILHNMESLSQA